MKIQIQRKRAAFTLIEVMFAVIAFFMASFAILALVSSSLHNARYLQRPMVDAGELASQLIQTNRLVEGTVSGNLADVLGDAYKNYTWTYDINEVQTNKLFQVDFIVQRDDNKAVVSKMSILLFRPASAAGSLDGATVMK
jgi:type II secretory pathway pseudopilin PulG